jgi:hypothetical protein
MVSLGNVSVNVDVLKTKEIYASIKSWGSKDCGCAYCRNYQAQVPDCFPSEVIEFMNNCGIDPMKDAEVYEMGIAEGRKYIYGGEYYFICKSTPDFDEGIMPNGFEFTILNPTPLEPEEFHNIEGSKCSSFMWQIPWVLNESP